jgi:DNA end-binding protein Ku
VTLHYADEVREAEPLFSNIEDDPADKELLAVATQLIDKKAAPFDPDAFRDHYEEALRDLVEARAKNRKSKRAPVAEGDDKRPEAGNVVDLMDALRKSLDTSGGKKPAKGRRTASKPRKSA